MVKLSNSFILVVQYYFIYRSTNIVRSILLGVRWSKRGDPDDQGRRGVTISLKSHWAQVTRSRRCTFVPACFLRRPTDVISRSDTLRSVSRHDLRKGFTLAEIDPRRPIECFCLISRIFFRSRRIVAKIVSRRQCSPPLIVKNDLFPVKKRKSLLDRSIYTKIK